MHLRNLTLPVLLLAILMLGCKKNQDPNQEYFKWILPGKSEKPLQFHKRRINLDTTLALETVMVYKLTKESAWEMMILKKIRGKEEDEKIFHKEISPAASLLDRILVKDFFKDGHNSIFLEFSHFSGSDAKLSHKKLMIWRSPFTDNSLLNKEIPAALLSKTAAPSSGSSDQGSPEIRWEDTNDDGHLELVLPSAGKKEEQVKYAYGKMNDYLDKEVLKFNGFEFVPFVIDKPFLVYRDIKLPDYLTPGQSQEVQFRISNLGSYTAKSYVTFTLSSQAMVQLKSLENFGKVYRPGRRIFNLKKNQDMTALQPVSEYTLYPWPKYRTYTFRFQITLPKESKEKELTILNRYSVQYRNRNTYEPNPKRTDLKTDQQGYPAYPFTIPVRVE